MNGGAESAVEIRGARRAGRGAPLATAIFRRQLRSGIALPIIFSMFLAIRVIWILQFMTLEESLAAIQSSINWEIWAALGLILAMCMGAVCGAEEEENKTADFARRLPVGRTRIFLEKTAASICVIGIYFALGTFILWFGAGWLGMGEAIRGFLDTHEANVMMAWSTLAYFAALACAAALRRVITGAAGGILVTVSLACFLSHFTDGNLVRLRVAHGEAIYVAAVYAMAAALTALAWARFITQEGR